MLPHVWQTQGAIKFLTVNHFAPRFQHTMRHLALIAMALMLGMPIISHWQQSQVREWQDIPEMCLSEASRAPLSGEQHDGHAHHFLADNDTPPPHEHHHKHDACGYCALATRILPLPTPVLALSPPPPSRHSAQAPGPAPATAPAWPAHSPRGPPLYS